MGPPLRTCTRPSHEDARVLMVVLISGTTMRTGGPMRTPRPAIHKGSGGGGTTKRTGWWVWLGVLMGRPGPGSLERPP